MSTVCCLVLTAAGVPFPTGSERQSRQMYVVPSQLGYTYYLPYGGQVMTPDQGFYPYQLTAWPYPSGNERLYYLDMLIDFYVGLTMSHNVTAFLIF
jgi:hypothetical protein